MYGIEVTVCECRLVSPVEVGYTPLDQLGRDTRLTGCIKSLVCLFEAS